MNGFVFFAIILGAAISYGILYLIIKAAVRNGIIEARAISERRENFDGDDEDGKNITQVTCPNCGRTHDMDYPKCPYCKHRY
jgi:rubrerythrin